MPTPAAQAMAMAARVRRAAARPGNAPLCVYDLVEQLYGNEIDMRFQALKSLEGMYSRSLSGPSVILVSTERPGGRRRYTCAHELGHHLFGHALSLDELLDEQREDRRDPREFLCDLFAGFLLMPKLGVLEAARARGIDLRTPNATQVYALAGYFGVGYSTFLTHASRTLNVVAADVADRLKRIAPQQIREQLLERAVPGDALVVDATWKPYRPADLVVGDHIVLPSNVHVEHLGLEPLGAVAAGAVYRATAPGRGRAEAGSWATFVRIERARYRGMARFRNLEECDEE
jgi:Zn-dependent peptidase ImmA (M78 family)